MALTAAESSLGMATSAIWQAMRRPHLHVDVYGLQATSSATPARQGLARLRHADRIEQCPLSGVTRKTFAHIEFFSV